jgi:uncharacterized protein (TIGR03437 family)
MPPKFSYLLTAAVLLGCLESAAAQTARIAQPVDNNQRIVLSGHLHPKANTAYDQGRVAPSLELPYVTLELAMSADQKADLDKLTAAQQTEGSPSYHKWLTPDQYAARFGTSDADVAKISQWLAGQGLKVLSVARAKNWIAVSGAASQVEAAFQTELHTYAVDGETHFANATEPSVPAAFSPVVKSIRGLNDFRMKPHMKPLASPRNTQGSEHFIAPDDWATIYDVTPLYTAGINGSGQKIVVAGQSEVNLSDIQTFRSTFNLPANTPQTILVPGSKNPGILSSSGDLSESDLDLEWSGAVARDATIIFVYATDVMTAVQYAIDQNLAPVLSVSYGSCELENPNSEVSAMASWAEQANAQGITWLSASGDDGAADCDDTSNPGLAVDLPGSIPYVTSVGGTEFVEGSGAYWSSSNSATGASALSYIPETTWNDSAADGEPSASGGGTSVLFAKPTWQNVAGVPSDNSRHVPDIALTASADHDGYFVFTGGKQQVYGGTSAPTPSFAGVIVLLNQSLGSDGVGNINPKLYSLAPSGWSSGMFHDVTTGNNTVTVPCSRRASNCGDLPVGYSAGAGYDQTTGLGSVDAYKLVTGWNGSTVVPPPTPTTNVTLLSNLSAVASNEVAYLTATVTSTTGTTPSGSVEFSIGGSSLGTAVLTGSAGTATATLAVDGSQLPSGTGTITATYDGTSSAAVTVSVTGTGSGTSATPSIAGVLNGASFKSTFAPGSILSVFGTQLSVSTQSASSVPLPISILGVEALINGIAAPLYYVSPTQLNIQIPYQTTPGTTAVLSINNNGQVSTGSFQVATVAPAIFTTPAGAILPTATASPGQEISFYITGTGAVSPAIATGAAPATSTPLGELPTPVQSTFVTIGGIRATIDFLGIPYGLVGVTQVNVQVPNGLAGGPQPVVVNVGGVASPAATVTIN